MSHVTFRVMLTLVGKLTATNRLSFDIKFQLFEVKQLCFLIMVKWLDNFIKTRTYGPVTLIAYGKNR